MVSSPSEPATVEVAKIVVAGGFGVGKTTLVAAISEIDVVSTEAWMTAAADPIDPLDPGIGAKTTTTVAHDFGRRTLAEDLVLFVFGAPGQQRFWPLWDDVARGAIGALVLVDARDLEKSFAAVNYFEIDNKLPMVVAVNLFDGHLAHPLPQVRSALRLPEAVPLMTVDARDPRSVATALVAVVDRATHHLSTAQASDAARPGAVAGGR